MDLTPLNEKEINEKLKSAFQNSLKKGYHGKDEVRFVPDLKEQSIIYLSKYPKLSELEKDGKLLDANDGKWKELCEKFSIVELFHYTYSNEEMTPLKIIQFQRKKISDELFFDVKVPESEGDSIHQIIYHNKFKKAVEDENILKSFTWRQLYLKLYLEEYLKYFQNICEFKDLYSILEKTKDDIIHLSFYINTLSNLKTKKNKFISSYNLHSENFNYLDAKTSTNENYNNNNLTNSINSNNGNNNIIFQNSFKKNMTNNIDNYSCNTNVNTKSHTINSINSVKGKENKKLVSAESTGTENNNNLITIDKINLEKTKKIKKERATSTNPYTVKTTNDLDNKDNNKNYHYYNSSNTSLYFKSNNFENNLLNYEIGRTLGKGAYAIVKVCTNKITKEKFAVKIYEKSKLNDNSKKRCVYREIEILKRINHNNIAKLYDVITTEKQILILQELVNGISLREYYNNEIRNQKGISEHKSNIFKKIFKQIFEAMNYIHKRNIAHRDIKLENILMTKNYEIKIIDFGFGMYNPQNKLQNFFCGTPNYMPPEIAFKKPYNGQQADLWSLGVLVYKMFCADFPFKGKNEKDLYRAIKIGKFKMAPYTPDYARKIIVSMIQLNPTKRMTCEMVLKSEWLSD